MVSVELGINFVSRVNSVSIVSLFRKLNCFGIAIISPCLVVCEFGMLYNFINMSGGTPLLMNSFQSGAQISVS